jgi:hypothetical protein
MLLVQQVQVHMTAKDGTRLLVGNLQSYTNPNDNEWHQIPGDTMRIALERMFRSAAQERKDKCSAASQGSVVMVMVGDFNLELDGVATVLDKSGDTYRNLRWRTLPDHQARESGLRQRNWVVTDRAPRAVCVPMMISHDHMHAAVMVDVLPIGAPPAARAASTVPTIPAAVGIFERAEAQDKDVE